MTQVRPDPKPARRIVTKTWDELRREKIGEGAPCRGCGAAFAEWKLQLHHLVPRGQRGDDVLENLVPLCSLCHGDWTDRNPRRWHLVADRIRRTLEPGELAYVVGRKGEDFLRRAYPLLAGDPHPPVLTVDSSSEESRGQSVSAGGNVFASTPGVGSTSSPGSLSECPHPSLEPGARCSCGYRKPRPKAAASPETKCVSFHMPLDSVDEFEQAEWAAWEHMGLVENGKAVPHARHKAVLTGYSLILQSEAGERVA